MSQFAAAQSRLLHRELVFILSEPANQVLSAAAVMAPCAVAGPYALRAKCCTPHML